MDDCVLVIVAGILASGCDLDVGCGQHLETLRVEGQCIDNVYLSGYGCGVDPSSAPTNPKNHCDQQCCSSVTIVDNGVASSASCEVTTVFRSSSAAPRVVDVTVGCVSPTDIDFNFIDGSLPGSVVDAGGPTDAGIDATTDSGSH